MAIRNNIVAKKRTELVVPFHKKTTKLVFLWPNMDQLCFKVYFNNHATEWRLEDVLNALIYFNMISFRGHPDTNIIVSFNSNYIFLGLFIKIIKWLNSVILNLFLSSVYNKNIINLLIN